MGSKMAETEFLILVRFTQWSGKWKTTWKNNILPCPANSFPDGKIFDHSDFVSWKVALENSFVFHPVRKFSTLSGLDTTN